MQRYVSRGLVFGLLIGWAISHATVFGQTGESKPASAADKLRANLDKAVTLDYTGQSLSEVISHFRDKTGIPVAIDWDVAQAEMIGSGFGNGGPMQGQISIKASNEKASQVLRRLLNKHSLNYILLEDELLVTSDNMAATKQFLFRVSVKLDEVPFKKAVRDLAKTHGINVVIDPKVMSQSDEAISLQLDNASVETTVRLLAELASLKAVRMGNVMYVTNEEKAKKIRDEEQHQFDNPPMHPSPYGYPPPVRAWPMAAPGVMPAQAGVFIGGPAPPPPFANPAMPIGAPASEPIPLPGKQLPPTPPQGTSSSTPQAPAVAPGVPLYSPGSPTVPYYPTTPQEGQTNSRSK